MRGLRTFSLTVLALGAAASAAAFAGFSIKPTGNQKLNIQTGTTVLEQGGSATDAKSGITVEGKYIEYKDGDFLRARTATLTTKDGGRMTSDSADYSAKSGVLTATGHINYSDARLKGLVADSATFQTRGSLVVARGNVHSDQPALSANTVVVDYKNNRAVMYGNYRYNYGGTSLAGSRADATLFVSWDRNGKPSVTTKPSTEQLAVFRDFLK